MGEGYAAHQFLDPIPFERDLVRFNLRYASPPRLLRHLCSLLMLRIHQA